jgi:hypothetical protein
MDNGDSHDDQDIELKGNGALSIHKDAPIIVYLQAGEVPVALTPKERNHVMHRAKWFKWEGDYLVWVWIDGCIQIVFCPEQRQGLVFLWLDSKESF